MILISHRGNIEGPNPKMENHPIYINEAMNIGFDVEVDVRSLSGVCYLGHDTAQYEVEWNYLSDSKLWCHAKNIEALEIMLDLGIHCFWHQEDVVTLTSRNFIWNYPGTYLTKRSICVLPETVGSRLPPVSEANPSPISPAPELRHALLINHLLALPDQLLLPWKSKEPKLP